MATTEDHDARAVRWRADRRTVGYRPAASENLMSAIEDGLYGNLEGALPTGGTRPRISRRSYRGSTENGTRAAASRRITIALITPNLDRRYRGGGHPVPPDAGRDNVASRTVPRYLQLPDLAPSWKTSKGINWFAIASGPPHRLNGKRSSSPMTAMR